MEDAGASERPAFRFCWVTALAQITQPWGEDSFLGLTLQGFLRLNMIMEGSAYIT